MDFSQPPVKKTGELRRAKTERSERKKARLEERKPGVDQLPDQIWARIGTHLGALERIQLGRSCKRLRQVMARWEDVQALEIRPDWLGDAPSACASPPLAGPSSALLGVGLPSLVRAKPKKQPGGFRLRLRFASGRCSRIRTTVREPDSAEKQLKGLLQRLAGLAELSLWDACLSERFRPSLARCAPALRCLRLWNCQRWMDGSQRCPALLLALLGLPSLRQLLLLDSGPAQPESACRWLFPKQMARAIAAPLEELQLSNCRLPLRSLELLLPKCANSLRRLAIGYTFGKDHKRVQYLRLLRQFRELADLDLPPFLFHLGDQPEPDLLGQRFLQTMPRLRALGFRHFNSSALFRFVEQHLPRDIRVLRVHHNAHRVPNFAELGLGPPSPAFSLPAQCPARSASLLLPGSPDSQRQAEKKHSVASRSSFLSSSDSLGCQGSPGPHTAPLQGQPCRSATFCAQPHVPFCLSSSSPCSSSACSSISWPAWPTGPRQSKRAKSFSLGPEDALSMATSSTWCTLSTAEGVQNEGKSGHRLVEDLAKRKLTIFAIAEERQGGGTSRRRAGRQQRLRRGTFSGVDVIYVSSAEALSSQEVLGRMGAPIQSPYVYTTGQGGHPGGSRGMRIIRGDLVRAIPLASLGMESDWESDEEAN